MRLAGPAIDRCGRRVGVVASGAQGTSSQDGRAPRVRHPGGRRTATSLQPQVVAEVVMNSSNSAGRLTVDNRRR